MKNRYEDILAVAGIAPMWWDENGTPRFATFHPNLLPDIYCQEACLLVIWCQNCLTAFRVGMSWNRFEGLVDKAPPLSERILDGSIYYGDPPNTGCCPPGPTMTSISVRVEQFWRRDGPGGWERDESFEIEL